MELNEQKIEELKKKHKGKSIRVYSLSSVKANRLFCASQTETTYRMLWLQAVVVRTL